MSYKAIKKKLYILGIRLGYIKVRNTVVPKLNTTNKVIEFVGPSGVGKTTILEGIKKQINGDWFYKEDLQKISINGGLNNCESNIHWQLLSDKVDAINNRNITSLQKAQLLKYFCEIIIRDLQILYKENRKGFLLDEGLCHNFSKELLQLTDNELKRLVFSRGFVFVFPRNCMTVVHQINKRKLGGQVVIHHEGLNDDKLKEMTELSVKVYTQLINRFNSIGIPVCLIYAEDDSKSNKQHILNFENQFLNVD